MNIFYLDTNPIKAAQAMTDKHIVKMILESAQLLSTAHRVLDGEHYIDNSSGRKLQRWRLTGEKENIIYKATHFNHPCALWVRESSANYQWLYEHFCGLCSEYTARYEKVHATETKLKEILKELPKNINISSMTPVAIAIANPDWIIGSSVESYRKYYIMEKLKTEKDFKRFYAVIGRI